MDLIFYSYAKSINKTFKILITLQICLSTIIITNCIFQLTIMDFTSYADLMRIIVYLLGCLFEFFLLCYYGNEITVKVCKYSIQLKKNIKYNIKNI